MSGKPPRYAGTCRHLTAPQRAEREARGLRPTLRFAVPVDQVIEFIDVGARAAAIPVERHRRLHHPARRRHARRSSFAMPSMTRSWESPRCCAAMIISTNTPRQLMLLDALGMRRPGYGHVGLLVGEDGAPLSKRHGSTSAQEFRERGFLPAALLNHLFRLGHASDIDGWLARGRHARSLSSGTSRPRAGAFRRVPIGALAEGDGGTHVQPRKSAPGWVRTTRPISSSWCVTMWCCPPMPRRGGRWCAATCRPWERTSRASLRRPARNFSPPPSHAFDQSSSDLKQLTKILKERTGRKGADLFMPLRVALTGQAHGPELGPLLKLMSPETARRRLESHAQNT